MKKNIIPMYTIKTSSAFINKPLKKGKMNSERIKILSLDINPYRFDEALEQVKELARHRSPSYVCFANVHMVVEAHHDPVFAQKVNNATLTLPDGVPLVKAG